MCVRARVCVCVCVYTGFPPLFLFLTVQQVKDLSRLLIGEKTSKFSIFIIFQKARNSTFYMEPAPWTRCFFKTVIHLAVSLKTAGQLTFLIVSRFAFLSLHFTLCRALCLAPSIRNNDISLRTTERVCTFRGGADLYVIGIVSRRAV